MYYFALTNSADNVWGVEHKRNDETWLSITVEHQEGDFCKATLTIKNPRHPWLSPDMNVWAWFTKDNTPFMFGRLDVVPDELAEELIKMVFVSRPEDYEAVKAAVAETKKVAPFWDEVLIAADQVDNPDVVLEARSELFHIDRVDLSVTTSDIINGEDGTIVIDNFFYDSLNITRSAAPVTKFRAEIEVSWPQVGIGTVNVSQRLKDAFALAGSTKDGNPTGRMSSFTGQGLEEDHPEQFDDLKGGWSIGETTLLRVDNVAVEQKYKDVRIVPTATDEEETEGSPIFTSFTMAEAALAPPYLARFYLWEFVPTLFLDYAAERQRIEHLVVELEADMQTISRTVTAVAELKLQSKRVIEPIDADGAMPIGDVRNTAYFITERGRRTVEYVLMLGRAKLLANSRAVEVTVAWTFDFGLQYSCRKNAIISNPRLPNGVAAGKIIRYTLVVDNKGKEYSTVTIGCAVGKGNTIDAIVGEADYADEDWDEDYQFRVGSWIMPLVGEITYKDFSDTVIGTTYVINDITYEDNANFYQFDITPFITNFEVINGETAQRAILSEEFQDIPHAVETLNASHTEVLLEMQAIDKVGPFITNYVIEASPLQVPRMIDLEYLVV